MKVEKGTNSDVLRTKYGWVNPRHVLPLLNYLGTERTADSILWLWMVCDAEASRDPETCIIDSASWDLAELSRFPSRIDGYFDTTYDNVAAESRTSEQRQEGGGVRIGHKQDQSLCDMISTA